MIGDCLVMPTALKRSIRASNGCQAVFPPRNLAPLARGLSQSDWESQKGCLATALLLVIRLPHTGKDHSAGRRLQHTGHHHG